MDLAELWLAARPLACKAPISVLTIELSRGWKLMPDPLKFTSIPRHLSTGHHLAGHALSACCPARRGASSIDNHFSPRNKVNRQH